MRSLQFVKYIPNITKQDDQFSFGLVGGLVKSQELGLGKLPLLYICTKMKIAFINFSTRKIGPPYPRL